MRGYKILCGKHQYSDAFKTLDNVEFPSWRPGLAAPINREIEGGAQKTKSILDRLFTILGKIGENGLKLDLPPFTGIYSLINLDQLKLFEPSLLDQEVGKGACPLFF
jgi:hypothetical protein